MLTVSTKELRYSFPKILEKLAQGEKFLLIHRSKPVAEIQKPQNLISFQEASDQDIEKSATKDLGQEFLSKKALQYYLSLK